MVKRFCELLDRKGKLFSCEVSPEHILPGEAVIEPAEGGVPATKATPFVLAPFKGVKIKGADSEFYTVEKMRFPKKDQKDTIIYNSKITIENIPANAYEYVVNGKSAIEWIMERYQVTTHKESGIKNDPNDWAKEVGNLRYILDLLLSVINVSLQTVDILNSLHKLDFGEVRNENIPIKIYRDDSEDKDFEIAADPNN